MPTLSIWTKNNKLQVVQLSEDPTDGTDAEQIAYLKTLSVNDGFECVSENYQGTFPDSDSSKWQWDNGQVITKPATLEETIAAFEAGIQAHLDISAQEQGYDNVLTACSYVGAPNPFEAESKTFVAWRGNVWAYCYQELQKVISGERPMPTLADIISELPAR